ncbi:uncharacterized protein LOC129578004 [Sitodiplosis mosellana]|uniref:uncharacterized protein LOC129578004 n=1 Tax=Sitodiplosis mosellana TaxID=263140 RepID=UPI002444D6E1|nr:uncharacterized protein LOC129578004 [Sitodiplosis mosellana]
MAETSKRTTNNSASKSRKSKNDIIRSTLGTYLKQKNYSMNEKFRKSDLALTQTMDQYDVMMMMDDDVAKVNSILYSNVLCLSNNQSTVELQFSKFHKFIQSQTVPAVKAELQTLLWPLLCHIYIEMIKGRDSRPAAEFLRKYAHLIGPVDNLYSPVVSEVNGQPHANQTQTEQQQQQQQQQQPDSQHKDITSPPPTSSTTQIIFASEDANDTMRTKSSATARKSDIELNSNDISDYFKELVSSLSLCLRIDEISSIDIARNFRSAKYEMVLSLQALYAMKHFLAKSGHVIILHILQNWFSLEIREYLNELEHDSDEDMDDINDIDTNDVSNNGIENNGSDLHAHSDGEEFDFRDTNCRLNNSHSEIRNLIAKVESEIRTVNGMNKSISSLSGDTSTANRADSFPTSSLADCLPSVAPDRKSFSVVQNKYLQNIRASVIRSRKLELPMRVFNVLNADHQLSCCDMDKDECHLVCGFDESTIKLWQLNQSKMRGRKPFSPFSNRLCDWCLENCETSSSSSSDIDSDDDTSNVQRRKRTPVMGLFARQRTKSPCMDGMGATGSRRKSKRKQRQEFMQQRHEDNIFADGGVVALRGHNKGVTDILFSRYNPLIFSVSKDNTMRAWKAVDYRCGAVYRGHNYPIWCLAESSTGLYLATGSRDLTARLWSTDREHPLQTYVGHTQDVDAIAFHPNGNYIATGSTDLTVRLWDVTSGKLLRVFIDCHLPVHCVSFSPDGRYLAAGGEESKIRIFDLAAGSQLNELKDHSADVNNIVWNSSSSKLASCCADGSVRVYSVNKIAQSSSNSSSQTPTASTSTSTSSNSNSNKLLISNDTGCKRALKVFFNFDDTISCIGSS